MYLKLRRRDTTVFLLVESSDSFGKLRQRLADVVGIAAASLKLYGNRDKTVAYANEGLLGDHSATLSDGSVLFFTASDAEPIAVADA